MELDELKNIWKSEPLTSKTTTDIMTIIQQKSVTPLTKLQHTYRKQMIAMAIIPGILIATNMQDMDKVFSSVLFWSYIAFCISVILFARYNYELVKKMQPAGGLVKESLEQQIGLLEKRAELEITGLRISLLFFVLLLEVVPYFQHYRMLDKWHSLSVWLRLAGYGSVLLLQYLVNRRLKEQRVGRHLQYLRGLLKEIE